MPQFYTYILTNWNKSVCYAGITNNMAKRLIEHWVRKDGSYTGRYQVYYLVWFETSKYVLNAIAQEKEIKSWPRKRKNELVTSVNPEWRFLNEEILGHWPPTGSEVEEIKEYLKQRKDGNNGYM